MLVYGDQRETVSPQERLACIAEQLAQAGSMPAGLARHATLVGALIQAGELLQGVADADFDEAGQDRWTPATDALSGFLQAVGAVACGSWDSGFGIVGALPVLPELEGLPPAIDVRAAEGFAFYSVYPEAYVRAARALTLLAPPRVIGIRSIGTTLAAVVAAALDAPLPVTLRPFGDPYARQVAVAPELERELLDGNAHYVIVDEGPGQSGSSFGAVADWLEARGVPLERIAFLPSHAGPPGANASEAHRARWDRAQRVPADFGADLPVLLSDWLAPVLGPADGPLLDISAGEWRPLRFQEDAWPPVVPAWERRKFIAYSGGLPWLLKFAGLGATGQRKFAMARALHSAGLTTEPLALLHGFLVERWLGDSEPLASGERPITELASYLGARARLLPAHEKSGATLDQLLEMCRRNISLALGSDWARLIEPWQPRLESMVRRMARVRTDNRLDRHEWLRLSDGRLVKTDALDHHCSHDLIGCQDLAWDAAGAIAEFGLDAAEAHALAAATELATGRRIDRQLLEFYTVAYHAFRLGLATAGFDVAGTSAADQQRLKRSADHHAAELQRLLTATLEPATRPASLVG